MKAYSAILLAAAIFAASCKSDPAPTSPFTSTPDAKAAEDSKSGGIYKGVIVGSSGFFVVVLQGGIKEIQLTVDGEKRTLTTTSLPLWVSGHNIRNAVFTSGDWSSTFSVGGTGLVPDITFDIAGHPGVQPAILKELSTDIVRVYEGTYAGTESGTWNFIQQSTAVEGVYRPASGAGYSAFFGLVFGNDITIQSPLTGTGKFSGDTASGTWQTDMATMGTWTGKRVM